MSGTKQFRILAVCTGNVCRSPLVERVLEAELGRKDTGTFDIQSAGTHALIGSGMTPQIAELVRAHGGEGEGFESRQVTERILAEQDLVLTLTREHRSRVLETTPKLLRRTFTLRQFGRMTRFVTMGRHPDIEWSASTYDRWTQLIPAAVSVRHEILREPDEDDVVDPYRRDESVHREMMLQIEPALEALFDFERAGRGA